MSENNEKAMRILVTGGSGFIGANLVKYFIDRNIDIQNIDVVPPTLIPSQESSWVQQDILDAEGLKKTFEDFSPTHVIHMAARTDLEEENDINGYSANIQGVENVLNAAKLPSVERVIIISSMLVCEPGYLPKDDLDFKPNTLYGESKVETEKAVRKQQLPYSWCIVRPAVIWGPQHLRLLDGFFKIMRKSLYFHPGASQAKRSYGYVGNSVYQLDKLLQVEETAIAGKVFYLTDPPINLHEWVNGFSRLFHGRDVRNIPGFILQAAGLVGDMLEKIGIHKFPMNSFRYRNMTANNIVPTEAISEVVGPLPYTMQQGIAETVDWIKEN